jgi:hypothetical protein
MKKNTVLKKEFKQRDVERMRNLIQGKYGEKTTLGIGYTKEKSFHNEGDVWDEDNRIWTIKNGIKQNITKLDKAKKGIVLPVFCPSCSKTMKPHLDKKWFLMYGHCFDCQVDFEANLKKNNQLKTFENEVINQHLEGTIEDFKIWFDELLNTKDEFITEGGDIEKWDGTGKEQLLRYRKEALEFLEKQKR